MTRCSPPISLPFLGHILDLIAAAAVSGADDTNTKVRGHDTTHLDAAAALIDEHHADPLFDVKALARRLALSVPHMHRLFNSAGTTPRRAIERRRVLAARAWIEAHGGADAADLRKTAESSGFSSVRRLRDALHRGH